MTAATAKILIVDDEPDIRGLLSLTFEQAGYVVKTAASGCDAVALCSDEAFDVVLSDITMPEMSGHELAQWIAAHRPTTHIAFMSTAPGVTNPSRAQAFGRSALTVEGFCCSVGYTEIA